MKHLLTTIFAVCLSYTATVAQEKLSEKAPQEKTNSKEEKAAAKAKAEANLQEAFKTAGFTADDQQNYKSAMEERSAYKKSLKEDSSLSEDDFNTKYKEFTKAQDAKLKGLIGDSKIKTFKDTQKAQKEAMKASN